MYNIDMNITRTYITYSVHMALFGLFLILIDNHDFILRRDIIFLRSFNLIMLESVCWLALGETLGEAKVVCSKWLWIT